MLNIIVTVAFLCALMMITSVSASDVDVDFPSPQGDITKVENSVTSFGATFAFVAQVLSVAAVVFGGLKYMFAAPDERANIKRGLIILVVGATLVFGAASVAKMIRAAAEDVIVY